MSDRSAGHGRGAGRYEIRLKGHPGSRWAARFDGMTLTTRADGTTVLEGPVVDQAALHGLLRTVGDLGIPLLSVTQVDPDHPSAPTSEPRCPINPGRRPLRRALCDPPSPQDRKESRWPPPGELRS